MNTKHKGTPPKNIHINKLSNITKNNFLSKLFSILFMLIGVNFAYATKLNFTFFYSESIGVVKFDSSESGYVANTAAGNSITTTTNSGPNGSSYIVTVDTSIKNGSSSIATDFNNSLTESSDPSYEDNDTSHMIDAGGPDHTASMLDFRVPGILSINNKVVTRNFYLAHTNSKYNDSPSDWWFGSLDGQIYTTASGSRKMTFTTEDGSQQYCLNQNNTNYEVIVSYGACNESTPLTFDWSNVKNNYFGFRPGTCTACGTVESVSFEYNQVHDDTHKDRDYLKQVTFESGSPDSFVKVTSKMQLDDGTADSFNTIFGTSYPTKISTSHYTNFLKMAKQQALPNSLDFWVQGNFYINGNLVSNNFTLAYHASASDYTWWIGSDINIDPSNSLSSGKMELADANGTVYCLVPKPTQEVTVYQGTCINIFTIN